MKLSQFDYFLDWPESIKVKNLRKYIMADLIKKGKIIRWSIIDIQNPLETLQTRKLRIHAVLLD